MIEQPHSTNLYKLLKGIMILHIECDFIASPWDFEETIDWYRKEIGYKPNDTLDIEPVDIRTEGLWVPIEENDNDFETLSYLFMLEDFKELIRGNTKDKFNNVRIIDGELNTFISYEDYCNLYLKSGNLMKKPEIIASTEF